VVEQQPKRPRLLSASTEIIQEDDSSKPDETERQSSSNSLIGIHEIESADAKPTTPKELEELLPIDESY